MHPTATQLIASLALAFTLDGGFALAWAAPSGLDDHEMKLPIAAQGVAQASIVIGQRASEVEKFAAAELQKYLKAISGAGLPIATYGTEDRSLGRILIGTPASNQGLRGLEGVLRPFAGPGADGFVGQTLRQGNQQALLLASNQPRGVLFAVYGFLEECLGVRFFGFDGAGEIIPLQPTINLDAIDLRRRPRFFLR